MTSGSSVAGFIMRSQTQHAVLRVALLAFVTLVLFILAASKLNAQDITGRWQWEERAVKDEPQIRFSLVIFRNGKVVRGVYSVDEFINGEWQGEDGNQTPFLGRIKGKEITIQFDRLATVPGYQQNVKYKAPNDGRQPATARLVLSGGLLQWQIISGDGIEGLPNKLSLRRAVRR